MALGDQAGKGVQVFGNRAFADQQAHPLAQFFQTLFGAGRLMLGADARRDISVQVIAAQQGRVAVDMAALKRL